MIKYKIAADGNKLFLKDFVNTINGITYCMKQKITITSSVEDDLYVSYGDEDIRCSNSKNTFSIIKCDNSIVFGNLFKNNYTISFENGPTFELGGQASSLVFIFVNPIFTVFIGVADSIDDTLLKFGYIQTMALLTEIGGTK